MIQDWFGFTCLRTVIGPEDLHHPLNQSDAKLKTIATWSGAFSRASSSLLVFIFEFSLASDKGSFCPIYQLGYFWFLVFRHALDNWPKTRKICHLLSLLIPNTRYLIASSHAHCSEVLTCDIPGFPRINIRTISRNMRNSRWLVSPSIVIHGRHTTEYWS